MATKRTPLRDLTPTESDLDNNTSSSASKEQRETLREKASKSLHGPNANPSQLGDPISLKAETSDNIPKPDEAGSRPAPAQPSGPGSSSNNNNSSSSTSGGAGRETLREKAAKKLHGPRANPSQLGDPISLKAEKSSNVPTPGEEGSQGVKGRSSKL